jgi:capsular polysaccharide biosynthesis protein
LPPAFSSAQSAIITVLSGKSHCGPLRHLHSADRVDRGQVLAGGPPESSEPRRRPHALSDALEKRASGKNEA